jgi:hypothetical protein
MFGLAQALPLSPSTHVWTRAGALRRKSVREWGTKFFFFFLPRGPFYTILHTAWLNNHALTLKRKTAKNYFGEKSSFLQTFQKICCESSNIEVKFKDFLISML